MQMISVYYVLPFLEYKTMVHICEEYAFNYKMTFNATKSQLLYFSYLGKDNSDTKFDHERRKCYTICE